MLWKRSRVLLFCCLSHLFSPLHSRLLSPLSCLLLTPNSFFFVVVRAGKGKMETALAYGLHPQLVRLVTGRGRAPLI